MAQDSLEVLAMAKMQDYQKQAMLYQQLISQGVPAQEAFKQAFPNGIPTQLDRAKEAAKANQQAGVGQLGGTIVGALGTKAVYDAVTGKPILGGIFDSAKTATDAAAAAGSTATNTASNVAPEILSTQRLPSDPAAGGGGLLEVGSTGGNILGGAGVALGGYNAFEGIKNKNPLQAGLGGGGVVLGLNQLGYTLGPWGIAAALAAPTVASLINKMGDRDRWKEEQSRAQKLADSGVTGWSQYVAAQPKLTRGRSIDELAAIEQAKAAQGQYSNETFARSRNEADLRPEDIVGYSTFGEKYGNDWFGKFSDAQRKEIADAALKAGAVREAKGQISIDWNKVNQPAFTQPTPVQESERLKRERLKQNGQFGNKLVGALS